MANGAAAAARGAAVNSRARRVVGEYERHARRIDEHCAGTRAGDDGPVLRRLREVGVTGLAIGARATFDIFQVRCFPRV